MRYIKLNAKKFRIDTTKIIACGGSAGGHLAASTAFVSYYNEDTDDLNISTKPHALILFNPVINNGPNGYGYDRIGNEYSHFSPIHNITKGAPPTIILIGTKDQLIPIETINTYKTKMDSINSLCKIKFYTNQKHGFFNYKHTSNYHQTLKDVNLFLNELGYLKTKK